MPYFYSFRINGFPSLTDLLIGSKILVIRVEISLVFVNENRPSLMVLKVFSCWPLTMSFPLVENYEIAINKKEFLFVEQ